MKVKFLLSDYWPAWCGFHPMQPLQMFTIVHIFRKPHMDPPPSRATSRTVEARWAPNSATGRPPREATTAILPHRTSTTWQGFGRPRALDRLPACEKLIIEQTNFGKFRQTHLNYWQFDYKFDNFCQWATEWDLLICVVVMFMLAAKQWQYNYLSQCIMPQEYRTSICNYCIVVLCDYKVTAGMYTAAQFATSSCMPFINYM